MTDDAARICRALAGHKTPASATITIHFLDGSRLETFFPASVLAAAHVTPATELPDNPTTFDAAVLRVMETLRPDSVIGAEELADRAGHSLNGHTRERLAALVRDGRIAGHGRRGYGPIPRS